MDVIKEDQYEFSQEGFQNAIHQCLEGGRGICEAKRHDSKLVMPMVRHKCCFLNVLPVHSDLVIS